MKKIICLIILPLLCNCKDAYGLEIKGVDFFNLFQALFAVNFGMILLIIGLVILAIIAIVIRNIQYILNDRDNH